MTGPRRTVLAVLLAILGIALAAAVTWGTSQIVSQRIGLASEPLTAGSTLLPRSAPVTTAPAPVAPAPRRPAPTVTGTTPPPVIVPTTTATSPAPETPAARQGSNTGGGSGTEGDRQAHRDD